MTRTARTRVTPLGVLALSLLLEKPMHPYQMMQTMRMRRADELVRLGPGALYHTVDRLVREGLAEAEGTERDGNRPDRTIYRATDLGADMLAESVTEMLITPEPEYPRFPVALSELNNLPRDTALDLLARRVEGLRIRRDHYAATMAALAARPLARRYWLQLDYQHAAAAAELTWTERLIVDLRSGTLAWSDPPATTRPDTDPPATTRPDTDPPATTRPEADPPDTDAPDTDPQESTP
ncbi:MAG: helix-turn-helix transcriptional regulator [Micrococcales bacterium]|nr:helix-turn-helix transcriptional regulator [Micrococcales bacterium]